MRPPIINIPPDNSTVRELLTLRIELAKLHIELATTNEHLSRILAALERHPLLSKFLAKVG